MQIRVLMVEDNEDILAILSRHLQFVGYGVISAKNGVDAVAMAVSQHPDVIVMDVLMPKMDGLEAISQLRNHPVTRRIPVLAATGWLFSVDRQKYLACGFDDCIAKPFTRRDLHAAIEKLLRESDKVRETS